MSRRKPESSVTFAISFILVDMFALYLLAIVLFSGFKAATGQCKSQWVVDDYVFTGLFCPKGDK